MLEVKLHRFDVAPVHRLVRLPENEDVSVLVFDFFKPFFEVVVVEDVVNELFFIRNTGLHSKTLIVFVNVVNKFNLALVLILKLEVLLVVEREVRSHLSNVQQLLEILVVVEIKVVHFEGWNSEVKKGSLILKSVLQC